MTKDLPPLSALILLPTSDLARQRKADTTAAAAAAIVAAAKAARSTNGVRLCSDPVLLGKDLIHRVDHATIAAAVDKHVLEPMSTIADSPSTVYTSAEDDANGDDAYSLFEKNQESPESLFMPSVQHNYTDRHYSREEVNASAHISICKYTLTELHAMRRDAAVNELLATEESYCRDLHILVNHFFAGIIDANCISDDAKQQLVRNGFSIFKFQSMFSAALLKSSGGSHGVIMSNVAAYHPYRDDRVISIARCFCEWGDKFDVYIDYCINHDKAVNLYKELTETNQSFAAVMNKLHQVTRASAGGGNGRRMFDDYLIMPVQRLFKYKLILESILKTTQSDSPEYTSLSQALIIMHEVAVRLNTKKSHMEAERKTQLFMDRLVSDWANAASKRFYGLLGPCLLIGTLDVRAIHDNAKIKRLGCALFNSYMIMVKAKRDDKYVPRHWFPLRTFHLEDIQSIFNLSWILQSEMQSFEFTATCEQEKQIWLDALQNAIQSSKADNAQCKTPANAMEELFVSSIGMQSSSPCVPLQGSSSSISLFSSLTQNECFQSTDTPRTGFSADSADTGSHAYGSVHSSLSSTSTGSSASSHVNASLQSPGLRSQASFSDFCDFVSSTMADIRSQRRYQQNSLRCTNVDNKFEDVCTTPILTARSQMRADRTSGIDQWKRKSRMGKSTSMLVFNSDVDDESKQHHYTLVSPWNKTVVNRSAHGETVRGGMYRKSSLPSRLRMAEPAKAEDRHTPSMFSRSPLAEKSALRQQQPWCQLPPQPQQPPLCPLPLPSSPRHAATTIGAESMILKLSRRGSTQGNCHVQQQKDHNLHHTPGLPRSLSAATMGFARTSSRLLGRVVEKLGTIGTPGSARRYTSSGFQPSGRVPQTSTRPDEVIVDTRTRKRPIKKPPPLVIPVVPRQLE